MAILPFCHAAIVPFCHVAIVPCGYLKTRRCGSSGLPVLQPAHMACVQRGYVPITLICMHIKSCAAAGVGRADWLVGMGLS